MRLLSLEGVTKCFGAIRANNELSLHVDRGEIVGVMGPNGSGKTTLFNSIVGQHTLDTGRVTFNGEDITGLSTAKIARRGLLRTFQKTRIYGSMSCLENLLASGPQEGMTLARLALPASSALRAKAADLLALMGLSDLSEHPAGELSFGQRRLLEIGMALMSNPRVLLLDEPTAGINPRAIGSLADKLKELNAVLGLTLLVIEHNIPVIMNLSQRIYCLHRGAILAEGVPAAVRADPRVISAYLGGRP